MRDNYNGLPDGDSIVFAWERYLQKGVYPEVMLPFGYGDGGGGVTEGMLEAIQRLSAFPGLSSSRQEVEEEFFADVRRANPKLPVWVGELYLETHRGTYTTQAATKRANRRNELLLREAELFGYAALRAGASIDLERLRGVWRNLLLLQFHDILPGSSIGEVYQEARVMYAEITETAELIRGQALAALVVPASKEHVTVFNSLSWERADAVITRISGLFAEVEHLEAVDMDGRVQPVQVLARQEDELDVVFAPLVPACGSASYRLRIAAGQAQTSLSISTTMMENRFFLLELTPQGEISRLYDKRSEREVIPTGEKGNVLQLFQDGPERESAWNIHATFAKQSYTWDSSVCITVCEIGPVRAGVRIEKTYRRSKIIQDIYLYDQLPRIDFVTHCDWQERQVLLKAAFPLEVQAMSATFEIQYGAVERPTHRNTSWEQEKFEVCGHRWADLSEGGYGVSLLNDCKYGYDAEGNVLRLTLLRGTEYPDPGADLGEHDFIYSLYPHIGDWRQGETTRMAASLNQPLICIPSVSPADGLGSQPSYFSVEGPAILDAGKPADDGRGWILRFYEPDGGRGTVNLRSAWPIGKVTACNHIEANGEAIPSIPSLFSFSILPYQVRTFRLE